MDGITPASVKRDIKEILDSPYEKDRVLIPAGVKEESKPFVGSNFQAALKDLEGRMGRIPRHRNGPREIDLDLLFWDDRVLQTPELTLPHPGIPQRAFVLVPLLQVAADWVHPALRKTVAELARDVSSEGIVRIVSLS